MKSQIAVAVAAISCLALASCGDGGQPKGQVVARVGKSEITAIDLQGELGAFKAPDAKTQKLAEQQALASIVQRKILVQAARKEKLDRSPEYARQRDRMNEALLVKVWQDQLVRAVPAPSLEDAQTYVTAHPDIYANRKKISIEGIQFATPNDPTLAKAIQPLKSLDEVRALLTARKIPFRAAAGEVDALAVDPRLVDQLLKVKPDDIFVLPQRGSIIVGKITGTKVDPVPNELAIRAATQYLKQIRTKEAVYRRFGGIVAAGKKDVKYAKGYEPPATPQAAPKPASPPSSTQAATPKPAK